jgi:hypothetical protein
MFMIRARLTDRHGAFIGYCDVPEQSAKDLPALPEAISLKDGTDPSYMVAGRAFVRDSGRTFVRDLRSDSETSRSVVPVYREVTFDWAENFRLDRKGGAA